MKMQPKLLPLQVWFVGAALLLAGCGQNNTTTEKEATTPTEATTSTTNTTTTGTTTGQPRDTSMMGGMHQGMMQDMQGHMQQMRGMRTQMTGDPDYDFAQLMTRHHEGGIRMAENEVANGTDTKLKEIANRTISSNKADIQKMQDFLKAHKTTKGDTATTMGMMRPMNKMMEQMRQRDMSGMNTDQMFAQMMIHHHEMGNELARTFLKQGKTQQMKQLAQKTIDQQAKEIKELEAWQKQNSQ